VNHPSPEKILAIDIDVKVCFMSTVEITGIKRDMYKTKLRMLY